MDPNEDPRPVEYREESSPDERFVIREDSNDKGGTPVVSEKSSTVAFEDNFSMLLSILQGTHKWSKYLDSNKNFEDVVQSLKIIYKYNPTNKGEHFPKARLGDIEVMRQDIMDLSSMNCFLAAQAAMYESNAENIEQERKLKRSQSWTNIRRDIRNGAIKEKMTQDDIKHSAEVDATDLYRTEYELRQLGRMFSWVRAAVRCFVNSLEVLVQSSMREERGDARLR
jgi:hypothetical protein